MKNPWRKHIPDESLLVIECEQCHHANRFSNKDVWEITKQIIKTLLYEIRHK